MSDSQLAASVLALLDGTADTFLVCAGAGAVVTQKTAAQTRTLLAVLPLAGGTMAGDIIFTDATYDIGKSGATRPRDGFFSRTVTAGTAFRSQGFYEPGGALTGWYMFSNGIYGYISSGLVFQFFETGLSINTKTTVTGVIIPGTFTVGTLPSAASNDGAMARVSDSSVTTWGSTVVGGGSSKVAVRSNGTNWTVYAT